MCAVGAELLLLGGGAIVAIPLAPCLCPLPPAMPVLLDREMLCLLATSADGLSRGDRYSRCNCIPSSNEQMLAMRTAATVGHDALMRGLPAAGSSELAHCCDRFAGDRDLCGAQNQACTRPSVRFTERSSGCLIAQRSGTLHHHLTYLIWKQSSAMARTLPQIWQVHCCAARRCHVRHISILPTVVDL